MKKKDYWKESCNIDMIYVGFFFKKYENNLYLSNDAIQHHRMMSEKKPKCNSLCKKMQEQKKNSLRIFCPLHLLCSAAAAALQVYTNSIIIKKILYEKKMLKRKLSDSITSIREILIRLHCAVIKCWIAKKSSPFFSISHTAAANSSIHVKFSIAQSTFFHPSPPDDILEVLREVQT